MEIVRIIADPKPTLYAIRYENHEYNELDRYFDLWNDQEYIRDFFKKHSGDLRSYNRFHHKEYGIEDAVRKTLRDAENIESRLWEIAEATVEYEVLQTFFRQLNDMETDLYPLQKSKGKLRYQSWLRIYAIRIDKDLYVVTGGTIKLTKTMQEREHTEIEINKMRRVVDYLRSENLINEDEFKRLELWL
jgi:hypothetical protein